MNYSRRQLYALGEPLGESVTRKEGGRIIYGGGGGGGGGGTPAPTQSTSYNTNVPEYAKPYVTTMLGATQKQLFEGTPTGEGGFDITGFKPYRPYSTDVNNYFAGFSPMQQQAQASARGLQTPGQFGDATTLAGVAGLGSLGAGQQYAQNVTDPARMQSFMSPFQQGVTDVAKNAAVREAQMAQNASNLGAARQGTYGGARQTLAQSERERNLLANLSNIQAQGSQSAFDRAMQAQQFGSTLGLQGLGQAGQAASTLGQLGGAQFGAQKDIIGLQNTMGAQQQALEQNKINQAIQDYATQQQYPLMQLGMMSNMLRGLPLQATTTQSYQATPSNLNQSLGLLAGAAGARQAGLFAEGGVAGYANRGIVQANPGSEAVQGIRQKLEMMRPEQLQQVAQTSSSEEVRTMALEVLREKQIREQAEAQAQQSIAQDQRGLPTPVTERVGLPAAPAGSMDMLSAASGGIVAFAGPTDGSQVKAPNMSSEEYAKFINEVMGSDISTQRKREIAPGLGDALNQILRKEQPGAFETSQNKGLDAASSSTSTKTRVSGTNLNDEAYKVPTREEAIAQIKKRNEDLGITGSPKESLGKVYAAQETELAEDRKRKAGYDLLNYGLELGTQPGGLLQAGLQAGKRALPGIIAREDALRERGSKINQSKAELEQADRLERLGYSKEAEVMRDNALNRFSKKDIAIMESESRRAIAAKDTILDKIYKDAFDDLVKNQKMDPNNPNTKLIARRIAASISGLTGEKVDASKEGVLARTIKEDPLLQQYQIDLMTAETDAQKTAVETKIAARRQVLRNEVYKTESSAPKSSAPSGTAENPIVIPS